MICVCWLYIQSILSASNLNQHIIACHAYKRNRLLYIYLQVILVAEHYKTYLICLCLRAQSNIQIACKLKNDHSKKNIQENNCINERKNGAGNNIFVLRKRKMSVKNINIFQIRRITLLFYSSGNLLSVFFYCVLRSMIACVMNRIYT